MTVVVLTVALIAWPSISSADTSPPSGTPRTVSADALPTVQINGIVWKQAIFGDKVYATGRFTEARPAGVAVGGVGSVTRTNLLAYDITTGELDPSFVHSLSGGTQPEGKSIAVSPDGTRLYVGGHFTTVDGQAHSNFAAFDLTTNSLLSGFSGTNGTVNAVAATNTQVFVGGAFTTAGGKSRLRVASYNATGAINTSWIANVDGLSGTHVSALATVASAGNLIIGGSFNSINGKTYYSNGAVKLSSGADVTPWASSSSSFPIRMQPPSGQSGSSLGVTSLSTDGTKVYFTAFTYVSVVHPGSFEGRAAISPINGNIIFINDCAGDSYDAFPIGQVLYSVSHAHNCSPMGGFTHIPGRWQRAMAETTYVTGTDGPGMGGRYPSQQGQPRGDILNWFPELTIGNVSGSNQAAWSVVGNANYVALGGEFPTVNGVPQQGLVRFTTAGKAPNKVGPSKFFGSGYGVMALPANSSGNSIVRVFNASDEDNGRLTYNLYRAGTSTLLASHTVDSRFWRADSWTYIDTGLPPGTSAQYNLVVKDPFNNSRTYGDVTLFDDSDSRFAYVGTWTNSQGRSDKTPDFNRGIHYTSTNGNSYTFTFYGSAFKIIGEENTGRGTMDISVDGGPAVSASAYNDTNTYFQQTIYGTSGLGLGKHTVKVTKTGGTYMDVDAVHVTADTAYDDNGSAVSYATPAKWTSRQNGSTLDYGGGIHYTRENGESAAVTFSGSSVALMSEKNSGRGSISVSIDGGTPVTASEYNATGTLYQQVVFSLSGLSPGTHTLKVTKLSGTYMDIDAVLSR
jgi:hypothetical protein